MGMHENTPVIRTIDDATSSKTLTDPHVTPITKSTNSSTNPLNLQILTNNGEVNINELHALQEDLILNTTLKYFQTYRNQYFHIDTGANVHATTKRNDFFIFHEDKRSINIAAGQTAYTEGYGVILLQLIPDHPPLPLAPVYYCPAAKTGTLSPQCFKLYNKCHDTTHKLFEYLSFTCPIQCKEVKLPTTRYNNLDFISIPITHFSSTMIKTPTVANMYTKGINNQLIHQRFDHRSMNNILEMKKGNMMNGLPANITTFHDEYKCPICLLTKTTKMKRNKTVPSRLPHKK